MGELLGNALTGVVAYQRSLATVGHNIANASTAGYSRQTVEFETRTPTPFGNDFIGSGVRVAEITRNYDAFLTAQIRESTTELSRLRTMSDFSGQVDDILADPQGGITPALQAFFASVQDLSSDPDSVAMRTVVLAEAEQLASRFGVLGERIGAQYGSINNEIESRVGEINALASSLAQVNKSIISAETSRSGNLAPDLLDRQDELLRQLSELVAVSTARNDNGTMDVFVGSGQMLVTQTRSFQLATVPDPTDGARFNVAYTGFAGTTSDITAQLSGGELGGLLDFRREVLDVAVNGLGRVAVGLAMEFNAQHRAGMDQFGALGGDFFSLAAPGTLAHMNNTGAALLTTSIVDANQLTTQDYELSFDGTNYTLNSLDGASSITAAGPTLVLDGLSVTVGAGALAGDSYLIRPTRNASTSLSVNISAPGLIAAAAPIRASEDLDNAGEASVSPGQVIDANDPNLLVPFTIQFNTPPSTYDLIDTATGAVISAGLNLGSGLISANGWQVQLSGPPAAGDRFYVDVNTGGVSDNRNALALAAVADRPVLDNGRANLQEAYGAVVGAVGTQTRQIDISAEVQASLLASSQTRREAVSGVNLDEEAARLVQLQQAYQASARMMQTAKDLFESLLAVL